MYKDIYSLLMMNSELKYIIDNLLKGVYHYGEKIVLELQQKGSSSITYKTYCSQSLPELIFHFTKMQSNKEIVSIHVQDTDITIVLNTGAKVNIHYQQENTKVNLIIKIFIKWSDELDCIVSMLRSDIDVSEDSLIKYVRSLTSETVKPIYQLTVQKDDFHYLLLFKLEYNYFNLNKLKAYEKKNNSCYIFNTTIGESKQIYRCSLLKTRNELRIRKFIENFAVYKEGVKQND
jgi:hypothetical protein